MNTLWGMNAKLSQLLLCPVALSLSPLKSGQFSACTITTGLRGGGEIDLAMGFYDVYVVLNK